MYARTFPRTYPRESGEHPTLSQTETLLIPQDYHGELLRKNRGNDPDPATESDAPAKTETSGSDGDNRDPEGFYPNMPQTFSAVRTPHAQTDIPTVHDMGDDTFPDHDLKKNPLHERGGDDSTLLLLGIGLLLFSGKREANSGLRSWDEDDIALLMIAFLLLS